MENTYRQVGLRRIGEVHKGTVANSFKRTSHPSIPAKYELILLGK